MDKIVLICQKRDERVEKLLKCLKYLFPECSTELKRPDQEPFSAEKTHGFSETI